MLQVFILLLVFGLAWRRLAPGPTFVRGFAALLERPERVPRSLVDGITGRQFLGGEYRSRPVTVLLRYKRGDRLGHMVIAMATSSDAEWEIGERVLGGHLGALAAVVSGYGATDVLGDGRCVYRTADVTALRSQLLRPEARAALDVLVHEHGLALALAGGWLRATWTPTGFFIFPGRFDPEKWDAILAQMRTLAESMEAA